MATEQELYDDIMLSVQRDGTQLAGQDPVVMATLRRIERTQYAIFVVHQIFLIVLSGLALTLLVWAGIKLANGEGIDALLTGIGGIVSGGGAIALVKRTAEARKDHKAALRALTDYAAS